MAAVHPLRSTGTLLLLPAWLAAAIVAGTAARTGLKAAALIGGRPEAPASWLGVLRAGVFGAATGAARTKVLRRPELPAAFRAWAEAALPLRSIMGGAIVHATVHRRRKLRATWATAGTAEVRRGAAARAGSLSFESARAVVGTRPGIVALAPLVALLCVRSLPAAIAAFHFFLGRPVVAALTHLGRRGACVVLVGAIGAANRLSIWPAAWAKVWAAVGAPILAHGAVFGSAHFTVARLFAPGSVGGLVLLLVAGRFLLRRLGERTCRKCGQNHDGWCELLHDKLP